MYPKNPSLLIWNPQLNLHQKNILSADCFTHAKIILPYFFPSNPLDELPSPPTKV